MVFRVWFFLENPKFQHPLVPRRSPVSDPGELNGWTCITTFAASNTLTLILVPSHTVYTIPLKIWCKFMLVTTHSEIQMVSLILLVIFWKSFYAIQLLPRKRETSCEVSLGEVASGIWGRWSWWPHVQMRLSSHWLCWQGAVWFKQSGHGSAMSLIFFGPLQRGWCITLGRGISWRFWYHFTILSRFKVYPTSSRYFWWKMMENDPMLN